MRIAFSGAHRVGKTTLIEAVAAALPDHDTVDEPYWLLEEEGYPSADPPTAQDFEAQLARSLAALDDAGPRTLFDRCPADVLAYLRAYHDEGAVGERVIDAMATLDLVVLVPIEASTRGHPDDDDRAAVEEQLRALLDELDVEVLDVHGDVAARAAPVVARARRTIG